MPTTKSNQTMNEDNYDAVAIEYLKKTEERLTAEILRDANISGRPPDRRLLDTKIERERQDILKSSHDRQIQEVLIMLLEIVAERIRNKSW